MTGTGKKTAESAGAGSIFWAILIFLGIFYLFVWLYGSGFMAFITTMWLFVALLWWFEYPMNALGNPDPSLGTYDFWHSAGPYTPLIMWALWVVLTVIAVKVGKVKDEQIDENETGI